jgi:hypothetical protein
VNQKKRDFGDRIGEGEDERLEMLEQRILDLEADLEYKDQQLQKLQARDLDFRDDATPPSPPETEQRAFRRHLIDWRVAVVNENSADRKTFHGRACDISLGGVSILCDHNIFFSESVILLLSMPARSPGKKPRIIEVSSQNLHTVLVLNQPLFRVGFRFLKFKRDGRHRLEEYLAQGSQCTSISI